MRRVIFFSNSDGSDEVFVDISRFVSIEINVVYKNKVFLVFYRGEFKKLRRFFKSDFLLIFGFESVEVKIILLDIKESSCYSKLVFVRSYFEVIIVFEDKNIFCELTIEIDVVVVLVLNGIEGLKVIVFNESKVVDE